MIPDAKLVLFLWKANALRIRERRSANDRWLDSTVVFGALGWTEADKQYFRNDALDVVRALAALGLVEVSGADTAVAPAGTWLNHAFAFTQAGLDWARPYQELGA